jgi:hypothetical protein
MRRRGRTAHVHRYNRGLNSRPLPTAGTTRTGYNAHRYNRFHLHRTLQGSSLTAAARPRVQRAQVQPISPSSHASGVEPGCRSKTIPVTAKDQCHVCIFTQPYVRTALVARYGSNKPKATQPPHSYCRVLHHVSDSTTHASVTALLPVVGVAAVGKEAASS